MANEIYDKLMNCVNAVKSRITFQPEVALILGSGLGDYAKEMEIAETVEYSDIEGFPVSTVAGHQGRFLFGYVQGFRWSQCRAGFTITRDTPCQTWFFPQG